MRASAAAEERPEKRGRVVRKVFSDLPGARRHWAWDYRRARRAGSTTMVAARAADEAVIAY